MSNLAVNNVIGLNQDIPYFRIMNFINSKQSQNTRTSYTSYYTKMFMFTVGKEIEQLTYDDVKLIDDIRVENYRNHLIDKGYKATYINQIIFACKALWDKFMERRLVEFNYFNIEPLLEQENSYGSLTPDEVDKLFQYCLAESYKPMTQKLYFEYLYTVTCRKTVAQTITWDDIKKELDIDTGRLVWVATFMDKGKEVKKAISDEFYDRILENYRKEKEISGKLFNVSNQTFDKTLKGFCKEYGISDSRNICQHSIKGSGLDLVQTIYKDINVTAQAAQHKSINTAYKKYINKNTKFSSQPSFALHNNYGLDTLKGLGEDVLLQLIQMAGKETIIKLNLELEKLTSTK